MRGNLRLLFLRHQLRRRSPQQSKHCRKRKSSGRRHGHLRRRPTWPALPRVRSRSPLRPPPASLDATKYLFLSVLLLTAVAALVRTREQASQPMNSDARAREIIHELKLTVLPKESGYLGIIGVSAQTVTT